MGIQEVRKWSNQEIKKCSQLIGFQSKIINVSGWKDEDKYGTKYAEYFDFDEYVISNYENDAVKGSNNESTYVVDLSVPVDSRYDGEFDLVFNHTTLEHLYNPFLAMDNLSRMSKDYILITFPWKQKLHFIDGGFEDYLRISPMWIRRYCKENGLNILYESATPKPSLDIYLMYLISMNPHHEITPRLLDIEKENLRLGSNDFRSIYENFISGAKAYIKHKVGLGK